MQPRRAGDGQARVGRARRRQPIRARISRSSSPGWVVRRGQSVTVTRPPVAAARARNGAALDRSGSMSWSTAADRTRERPTSGWRRCRRPRRRASRSIAPSSRCGGATAPACRRGARRRRGRKRAPASSSAETNWEDALRVDGDGASGTTRPCTVKGSAPRPPSSSRTPSARRAASIGPTGRVAHVGVAVEARPSRRPARRPGARSASRCRRGRSRPRRRGPGGRRDRPVAGAGVVDARAERGEGGGHEQRCRASAGDVVRRSGRRRSRRARGHGWSATCCRAARRPGRRVGGARGRPEVTHPRTLSRSGQLGLGELGLAAGVLGDLLGLAAHVGGGAAGPPGQAGLALGVDRGEEQAAEDGGVLVELQALGVLGLGVGLVPEGVAGRGSSARGRPPARSR